MVDGSHREFSVISRLNFFEKNTVEKLALFLLLANVNTHAY